MSAHALVADLIEIILSTVAAEAHTTQDQLSVEVESVVTRGVLEAFKRGEVYAHDRPTEPPRNPTPARGTPVVWPKATRVPRTTHEAVTQPRLPAQRRPKKRDGRSDD